MTPSDPGFEHRLLLSHYQHGVGEAIIVLDVDGRIRGWPPSCELMLGYAASDAVGLPISTIFTAEDVALRIDVYEREAAAQQELAEDDRWHVRQDGTRIWVTGTLSAVRDDAGTLLGFVKILRDRTDLRTKVERLEHELEASSNSARHDNQFLQTVGHELRNPLVPLGMAVELLKREKASDKVVGIIQRQVAALTGLANNLIDMERARQGGIQLVLHRLDLREILDGAIEDMRPQAEQKGVNWKAVLQPTPIYLEADATRLGQVVANLLSNALRYTPRGGTVMLRAVEEVDEVVVRIEDDGLGIDAELLPRLFQFFTRGLEAESLVPGGLGVGLALSREIVEAHGGNIAARSAGTGKGAEFMVRLPLRRRPD